MRRRNWTTLFALLTAVGIALAACERQQEAEPADEMQPAPETAAQPPVGAPAAAPSGATPEMVAQGQQIFTGPGNCYTCHGMDAKGTQLAPNLTDAEWINISAPTVDNIVALVKTGVPQPKQFPAPMPPMGGAQLTDDQVRAVASYVASLSAGT